jgi:hypothetical protein
MIKLIESDKYDLRIKILMAINSTPSLACKKKWKSLSRCSSTSETGGEQHEHARNREAHSCAGHQIA